MRFSVLTSLTIFLYLCSDFTFLKCLQRRLQTRAFGQLKAVWKEVITIPQSVKVNLEVDCCAGLATAMTANQICLFTEEWREIGCWRAWPRAIKLNWCGFENFLKLKSNKFFSSCLSRVEIFPGEDDKLFFRASSPPALRLWILSEAAKTFYSLH